MVKGLTLSSRLSAFLVFGLCVVGSAQSEVRADKSDLLPPDAKPGECYARVYIPPAYETKTDQVLKSEASEKITIVPARFETVKEKVVVKEAFKKLETIPAVFETIEEKVMVKPPSKKLVEVPAEYETVTEQVLEKPAYTTWKKGSGPIQKIDDATGEIMCLVEVPAVYKSVTKRVLKRPAGTQEVEVPAEYAMVKKQVLKSPATTKEIEVPAEFKVVEVQKLVEPAREVRTSIPAEFETVSRQVKTADGRVEWRQILCETNMTKDTVSEIQAALRKAGFDPGTSDGKIGKGTIDALNSYQRSKGLPVDQFVNLDTLRSLGITVQ
jgi:hypothetical protein